MSKDKPRTAAEMGRKGGKTRAKRQTAKQRSELASRAAKKRWAKMTPQTTKAPPTSGGAL